MVHGDSGQIPSSRKFSRRLACGHAHPGLCFTADRLVYDEVMQMAKNIETALTSDMVGSFLKFSCPPTGQYEIVYFAHHRVRRGFAIVTHVFARCDVSEGWFPNADGS
jgi:hypothetical protein